MGSFYPTRVPLVLDKKKKGKEPTGEPLKGKLEGAGSKAAKPRQGPGSEPVGERRTWLPGQGSEPWPGGGGRDRGDPGSLANSTFALLPQHEGEGSQLPNQESEHKDNFLSKRFARCGAETRCSRLCCVASLLAKERPVSQATATAVFPPYGRR